MIARVIPIDSSFDSFGLSYYVPEDIPLRIGELIEIPLREVISYAFFAGEQNYQPAPSDIKSIVGTTSMVPLDPSAIESASRLAKRHAIHIHKTLALFYSKGMHARLLKYGMTPSETQNPSGKQVELCFAQDNAALLAECLRAWECGKSCYIFPTDSLASSFIQLFWESRISEHLLSAATDTKRAKVAIAAVEGKYDVLVWTRRLCTYNLSGFDRVVYVEDSIMKDTLHSFHRYSYLEVMLDRSETMHPELKIISVTPSISLMSQALAGRCTLKNV